MLIMQEYWSDMTLLCFCIVGNKFHYRHLEMRSHVFCMKESCMRRCYVRRASTCWIRSAIWVHFAHVIAVPISQSPQHNLLAEIHPVQWVEFSSMSFDCAMGGTFYLHWAPTILLVALMVKAKQAKFQSKVEAWLSSLGWALATCYHNQLVFVSLSLCLALYHGILLWPCNIRLYQAKPIRNPYYKL